MQLGTPGRPHFTYCTNIHPGESLAEVRRAVTDHVTRVRDLVRPAGAFGVGLRLSAAAAEELSAPAALRSFRELLDASGLYVFTLNGFPYGAFHGARVKESVYRPDWGEEERFRYTRKLGAILAALLPEGVSGSISTVPGAFRERGLGETSAIADRLLRAVADLHEHARSTGKYMELSLEPEPACLLETTDEAIRFFESELLGSAAVRRVSALTGLSSGAAEAAIRRHLGVCFDACHLAVEFEDARESVARLRGAGIRIGKIQVTVAPVLSLAGEGSGDVPRLAALERFADGVYLHQVVVRAGERRERFVDLPDALAAAASFRGRPSEWRTHFHVPIYEEALGPFGSTRPFLRELLSLVREGPVSDHLEVETYTWDVLPPELRQLPVEQAIAHELSWTLAELGERPSPGSAPAAGRDTRPGAL